jgi:hypothetical protein
VSVAQLIVTAVISILVTLPAVLLIPRARQSPVFDRVLWLGTWFLAFLSASFVQGNINLPALNVLVIGEVSAIPTLIGAAVGAFGLNGLLWLMDSSSRAQMADAPAFDDTTQDQAEAPASADEEGSSGSSTANPN